jgi:hypothetical protein
MLIAMTRDDFLTDFGLGGGGMFMTEQNFDAPV